MNYNMRMYLVDHEALRAAIGSKSSELFDEIALALSDYRRFGFDDQAEAQRLSAVEALRAVINGGPFEKAYAIDYLEAAENICVHLGGESFDDPTFNLGWMSKINRAFDDLGLAVETYDILERYPHLLGLPEQEVGDVAAGGGYWSNEDCVLTVTQRENADIAVVNALDTDLRNEIEQYVWCCGEAKKAGKDIVAIWGE